METTTQTLTMPLMHVYHLTHDGANTGHTLEEVTELMKEYGSEHQIEITVTTTVSEPPAGEQTVDVSSEEVSGEQTLEEKIADGYNPDARDGDGDGIVQEGTKWERPVDTQM